MEALLRLGRAYYVVGLDHSPAIEQSLNALERARQLAVQLGDRRGEARALIPTHRHVDFNPDLRPQAAANAQRALEIARELGDEDLEMDALRAAHRMGTVTARRESIEGISTALERRGDLIALNEHLFDSMWTYWRAGHFTDCVACCDRATALAGRLGIPPVQYGTIKSFALVDLGRFDQAWQALEQEVADDDHPFGQAFQRLGRTCWHAASGDVERVIRDAPRNLCRCQEHAAYLDDFLGRRPASVGDRGLPPRGNRRGNNESGSRGRRGRLTGESLVAAQLRAGNADAALKECERILSQLEAEGQVRAHWIMEELRIRALFALDRFADAPMRPSQR